jgi:hypothetical protein
MEDPVALQAALRSDEAAVLVVVANHIAATLTSPEDPRLEIAYAIARYLALPGWPAAWRAERLSP